MLVAGPGRVDPVVEDHVMAAEVGVADFPGVLPWLPLFGQRYTGCALVAGVGEVTRSFAADFSGVVFEAGTLGVGGGRGSDGGVGRLATKRMPVGPGGAGKASAPLFRVKGPVGEFRMKHTPRYHYGLS